MRIVAILRSTVAISGVVIPASLDLVPVLEMALLPLRVRLDFKASRSHSSLLLPSVIPKEHNLCAVGTTALPGRATCTHAIR